MKVSVLGAGAWGTALARLLSTGGHSVTLWAHDPARLAAIRATGFNTRHLPGVRLPAELTLETDLAAAVGAAECLVLAVPSKAFREIARAVGVFPGLAVSVTKGIEHETGLTMCGLLEEVVPGCVPVALSGPSLAEEVGRDIPTAIVAASADASAAQRVQDLFHRPTFRVYTSADRLGVELGGALKNVIAIGAGLCDGLGFGDNSKAALITRAIVEIQRLGVACGAQAGTFAGLSGLGDLTVTCFSKLSRNRSLGEQLGRGGNLAEILAGSTSVAEGHPTARSAYQLARRHGVETPIIDEVYALLWQGKSVKQSLRDLTSRTSKAEDTGYRTD